MRAGPTDRARPARTSSFTGYPGANALRKGNGRIRPDVLAGILRVPARRVPHRIRLVTWSVPYNMFAHVLICPVHLPDHVEEEP